MITAQLDVSPGMDRDIREHAARSGVTVNGPIEIAGDYVVYEVKAARDVLVRWLERWCPNASREAWVVAEGRYLVAP